MNKDNVPHETKEPIIIFGAGGHGKAVIDLVRSIGDYRIFGLIDDSYTEWLDQDENPTLLGESIIGGKDRLGELIRSGISLAANAVGGIGNISTRIEVFENLRKAGFTFPNLIHPSTVLEDSASLDKGIHSFPLTYIGSDVKLGFGVILNTGTIVSHDCIIGNYTNISPGTILAGGVRVGKGVLIGMGVTINLDLEIGDGAMIGNGATVKANIPENTKVRAGSIWPK